MIYFKLKDMLNRRKMTQLKLVEITGIRQPTISAICVNRQKSVSVENMNKICKALDCQPGDWMEYIPDEQA